MLLTLLALAAPLPAFAISDQALEPVAATPGPAAISVSASLDSCGVLDDGVVCKLDVSYSQVPRADSYSATVTRADGSVIDYGAVGAGGTSLWVPYVGAGNYSVRITAYGEPEGPHDPDGHGEVIATGSSRTDRDQKSKSHDKRKPEVKTEAGGRGDPARGNADADGAATTGVGTSAAAACDPVAPAPATPPTPPEEPPEDLDPDNPDEDADGIPDAQERAIYEQQLAEYQAALAAQQQQAPAPAC